MSPYTSQLLALRYDRRWMSFIEPMSLGLGRRVLSVLAYARHLCPHNDPAGHYDGKTVTLTWHWKHCVLTIRIPPCHPRVFDEPLPGEESESITATFMDGASGEFWVEEIVPGTGAVQPVFPPRLEMAFMDMMQHVVKREMPKRSRVYISAFLFKRLFPDLPVVVDLYEAEVREKERGRFRERLRDIVSEIRPLIVEGAAALGRSLIREGFSLWRQRHAQAQVGSHR